MAKGTTYPPEGRTVRDRATGAPVRQVTGHPSIHHHPFFFVPAYDAAMRRLIFVSFRTGAAQIFAEERATGRLVQITDRNDLADWSIAPSQDGRYVYFTAGTGAWRVDLETLREEKLVDFGDVAMRERGMVGAAMGTTALSWDDRWWAVPVKAGPVSRFVCIDTRTGKAGVFLERDTIGHPQFCPDDSNLIFYAGPLTDRVWVVNRDGTGNRRLYARRHRMQWITHESWIPGTRELAMVDWPNGMLAVHADTGAVRPITAFPAWHAASDASGRRIVCDTNVPDIGIHALDARDGRGEARLLCLSEASSVGAHWGGPFPYNDGPVEVYAPQHTHPHPRFSPDGSRIVFTSDRTGHAQIYECLLDAGRLSMDDGTTGPSPSQRARLSIREGRHTGTTRGLALGYVQCNLVILRECHAYDFLLYCQRNQKACPVLEVTDRGDPEPRRLAPGADLRTDLPLYAVYRDGRREADRRRIEDLWRPDFVAFLIGSGITFDLALERAGVPTDRNRWVLRTALPTEPAGIFRGPMVVTMRWLTPEQAIVATQVSSRFPFNHGAPIHIGDPARIGADLANPMFGPPVERVPPAYVPVFWACGVTPQEAALAAQVDVMITHAPAHGFVTDLLADRFCMP